MSTSKSTASKIRTFMERNPDAKPAHIAKALKIPVVRVYSVRALMKKETLNSIPMVKDTVTNIKPAQWNTIAYAITKGPLHAQPAPPTTGFKYYMHKLFGWLV